MWQQKVLDQWNQSENTNKPLIKFLITHNQVLFVATETTQTITLISLNYKLFTISKKSVYIEQYIDDIKAYYIHQNKGRLNFHGSLQYPKDTKNKNEKLVLNIIKDFRNWLNRENF